MTRLRSPFVVPAIAFFLLGVEARADFLYAAQGGTGAGAHERVSAATEER